MASFSAGRPTSLVIDIGASGTRIQPVVDGYNLSKGLIESTRGCNYMEELLRQELLKLETHTHATNTSTSNYTSMFNKPNVKSPYTYSPLSSYTIYPFKIGHNSDLFAHDFIRDIRKIMCFIPYKPISITHNSSTIEFMDSILVNTYTLPDGTVVNPAYNLCAAPERALFPLYNISRKRTRQEIVLELSRNPYLTPEPVTHSTSATTTNGTTSSNDYKSDLNSGDVSSGNVQPLHHMILSSLSYVDVDARKSILNNVLLTGGGSLTDGLQQRLSYELTEILPPPFKVHIQYIICIYCVTCTYMIYTVLIYTFTTYTLYVIQCVYMVYIIYHTELLYIIYYTELVYNVCADSLLIHIHATVLYTLYYMHIYVYI